MIIEEDVSEEEFLSKMKNHIIKAPDYFSKPIEHQIAIQVAETIRVDPSIKVMMVFTYDPNREEPKIRKLVVETTH